MKHISAILGSPKTKYIKKFAWIPTKLNDKTTIWFDYYVQKILFWENLTTGYNIKNKTNISTHQALLEKIK